MREGGRERIRLKDPTKETKKIGGIGGYQSCSHFAFAQVASMIKFLL